MKKILFLLMLCLVSCHKQPKCVLQEPINLDVDAVMVEDAKYMAENYNDYVWYETSILLDNFLDEDLDGGVKEITSIYQVQVDEHNVKVVMRVHNDTETKTQEYAGWWAEDFAMEQINVTFTEALNRIREVNYPKPHSRHVVLRKELGPHDANPQYIFGNSEAQLYVDAITAAVTDKNPVWYVPE